MDFSGFSKILFDRIKKFEPELVSKIIGYHLLKDFGDREMIRVAFGPDSEIQSLIDEAKAAFLRMGVSSSHIPTVRSPIQPVPELSHSPTMTIPQTISTPASSNTGSAYWYPQASSESDQQPMIQNFESVPALYLNPVYDNFRFVNQAQSLSSVEHIDPGNLMECNFASDFCYQDASLSGSVSSRTNRRSLSLPNFPMKPCHYHYKGYCKHGTSCKYFHGQPVSDGFPRVLSPNSIDAVCEDHILLYDSLKKLEVELIELLKSRGGEPISIAVLPTLYFEKYGKALQAEGYLTESQRHGKAGCNLTKLLARLKNSIRLLDRPHGQHSVTLAEDVPRHLEYRNERSDSGNVPSSSRQIYLTFPAESTFSEDDLANHFEQYGPVMAVRIPAQPKRMYGFVTFVHPETVNCVFAKGNPHYVCGAQVLVKPYKEKTRGFERKYSMKAEFPFCYPSPHLSTDSSISRNFNSPRLLRKPPSDENSQALELELSHLSQLQLAPRQLAMQPYFSYGIEGTRILKDDNEIPSTNHTNFQLDASNDDLPSDNNPSHANNVSTNKESDEIKLPDSPFASPPEESNLSTSI